MNVAKRSLTRLLALAAVTAETEEQGCINRLREADRLRDESRYDEAEEAYIAARKQAKLLGAETSGAQARRCAVTTPPPKLLLSP